MESPESHTAEKRVNNYSRWSSAPCRIAQQSVNTPRSHWNSGSPADSKVSKCVLDTTRNQGNGETGRTLASVPSVHVDSPESSPHGRSQHNINIPQSLPQHINVTDRGSQTESRGKQPADPKDLNYHDNLAESGCDIVADNYPVPPAAEGVLQCTQGVEGLVSDLATYETAPMAHEERAERQDMGVDSAIEMSDHEIVGPAVGRQKKRKAAALRGRGELSTIEDFVLKGKSQEAVTAPTIVNSLRRSRRNREKKVESGWQQTPNRIQDWISRNPAFRHVWTAEQEEIAQTLLSIANLQVSPYSCVRRALPPPKAPPHHLSISKEVSPLCTSDYSEDDLRMLYNQYGPEIFCVEVANYNKFDRVCPWDSEWVISDEWFEKWIPLGTPEGGSSQDNAPECGDLLHEAWPDWLFEDGRTVFHS